MQLDGSGGTATSARAVAAGLLPAAKAVVESVEASPQKPGELLPAALAWAVRHCLLHGWRPGVQQADQLFIYFVLPNAACFCAQA